MLFERHFNAVSRISNADERYCHAVSRGLTLFEVYNGAA